MAVVSVTTSPYASGLTSPVVKNDHDLAAVLAEQAGELLIAVRAELSEADVALRNDEGDRRSHNLLMHELQAARPTMPSCRKRARTPKSD